MADVIAYVSFSPTHALSEITEQVYSRLTGNPWESTVYLGFVNLMLLGWTLFYVSKKSQQMSNEKRIFIYILSGVAVFGVLASGASLHLLGQSIVPMPDRLLDHLPLLRNIRAPSRAIVFVYLFLAIGIGQSLYVLMLWQGNMTGARRLVTLGVAGPYGFWISIQHISRAAFVLVGVFDNPE